MATLPLPSHTHVSGGVLVASSDAGLREQLVSTLNTHRWPVLSALGGADALGKLESSECDVLLLDRQLSDLDSEELLRLIGEKYPGVEVLEIDSKTRNVIASPRRWTPGVSDVFRVLEKFTPVSSDRVSETPQTGSGLADNQEDAVDPLPGMVGNDPCMQQVYRLVRLVARRATTVLITGPTGTGKELVARAIHDLSPRANKPFVVINCAAIPEALLEAELFGHTRGAFTGAVQPRAGRVQSAQGGTLFLDEIGELPIGLQAKLLRFLEKGEIQRLGSSEPYQVDVRVVAATNAQLVQRVEQKEFREDLYFRLAVFPIELPPLAERMGDVPRLTEHFLAKLSDNEIPKLSGTAVRMLEGHSWPGNVRELQHVLERALILSADAPMIGAEHIHFSPGLPRPERWSPRKGPVCA
jgi:DNA-binding NtrC family response regulator